MRIAMIGAFGLRSTGALTARALPLAKALVARGHQVELVVPPWDNTSDARREWTEEGVEIKNTGVRLKPLIAPRLARTALSWKPDVIHFFKPKAYSGLAAVAVEWAKFSRLSRTRLVIDEDGWEGAGRWNDRSDYAPLFQRIFAWQDKHSATHNNALTVASRPIETYAIEQGARASRVFYLPSGAGLKVPDRSQIKSSGGHPTVLLYARFFEFSVARVIEIWKRVLEKCPGSRFMVVGKGYNGEEEELLDRARGNGFFEQVSYHGWVADEAVPRFFAKADIAIYPFEDTLENRKRCAIKLPDLLAEGLAVVGDEVGQIPEYIRHGDTGLLIKPGDVEGFATGVVNLLADRDLRFKLGNAARVMMEGEFGWDKLAQIAEKAYTA